MTKREVDSSSEAGSDTEVKRVKTSTGTAATTAASSSTKAKSKEGNSDLTPTILTNEQGEQYFDLGGMKRVTIRKFKGKQYVDIREFYTDKDGSVKPGKKGISLNGDGWTALMAVAGEVNKII